MLKFVGGLVLVVGLIGGAAVFFGWLNVDADAGLTSHGSAQVQEAREKLADQISGRK